jgi:bifunctional DNase/RNase
VPIFVDESVLDKAGILLDKETGKPIGADQEDPSGGEKPAEVKEEELRRMSAFTDFIDSLDLEDFGKEGPKK